MNDSDRLQIFSKLRETSKMIENSLKFRQLTGPFQAPQITIRSTNRDALGSLTGWSRATAVRNVGRPDFRFVGVLCWDIYKNNLDIRTVVQKHSQKQI